MNFPRGSTIFEEKNVIVGYYPISPIYEDAIYNQIPIEDAGPDEIDESIPDYNYHLTINPETEDEYDIFLLDSDIIKISELPNRRHNFNNEQSPQYFLIDVTQQDGTKLFQVDERRFRKKSNLSKLIINRTDALKQSQMGPTIREMFELPLKVNFYLLLRAFDAIHKHMTQKKKIAVLGSLRQNLDVGLGPDQTGIGSNILEYAGLQDVDNSELGQERRRRARELRGGLRKVRRVRGL